MVNEVVSDSGEFADGLRRSEWYRILGESFIDLAFQYANEAFNDTYAVAGQNPVTAVHQRLQHRAERQAGGGTRPWCSGCWTVACRSAAWATSSTCRCPVNTLDAALTAFDRMPVVQAVTELDVTTGR